jgi:hypothetical protein
MLVFFDTEFSNFEQPSLISVGLASADGRALHIELAPSPETWTVEDCSVFVRQTVLPLLTGPALTHAQAREAALAFLRDVATDGERPLLVTDFTGDWVLLRRLVDPLPEDLAGLEARLFHDPLIERYDFGGRRHHALVDAEALRWAFAQSRLAA